MPKTKKFPFKKPEQHTFKTPVQHIWSQYQKAIFRNIGTEEGHLIVEAYAGSAKTTSIIESFKYIPRGKKTLALAFNKIIQEELRSRAPSYIDTLTFHSLGFRAIKQRFGAVELDDHKVFNLVRNQLGNDADFDLITNICDTVAFCKYSLEDTPKQIDSIITKFGIDLCEMDRQQFISLVIKTLGADKLETSKIDFNDMCWMPFVYNLPLGQYDLVFCDEYQDLNKSQMVMAKKSCKNEDSRIVVVGDPFQALYSWRAADTTVVDEIRNHPKTKTLPLPISYRCPKKVIELAQQWVPDISCPETAIEGEIHEITLNQLYSLAKPGCFILSRTNAPMIKICMALIRAGIKANIRGRDVGQQLGYLIKKSKKKQIPSFLKWLETWKEEEVVRCKEKNFNPENVLDRYECLVNLCEECTALTEVSRKITELFDDTDENNIIVLSSVHRAKGLQRDDVFVLKWTFRVWFDKMHLLEKPNEESNIGYVAISRTVKRLFIVSKNLA
jgi:DNA helicase II / ATP-dependent DNA helicase PcrA